MTDPIKADKGIFIAAFGLAACMIVGAVVIRHNRDLAALAALGSHRIEQWKPNDPGEAEKHYGCQDCMQLPKWCVEMCLPHEHVRFYTRAGHDTLTECADGTLFPGGFDALCQSRGGIKGTRYTPEVGNCGCHDGVFKQKIVTAVEWCGFIAKDSWCTEPQEGISE